MYISYSSASFQSLFLWTVDSKDLKKFFDKATAFVSILVFMDCGLKGRISYTEAENPARFQSLFLWTVDSKGPLAPGLFLFFQFQSLFLWTVDSKALPTLAILTHLYGFNPCFYGLWTQSSAGEWQRSAKSGVSILVFMDCGLKAARIPARKRQSASFNPCFYGLWTQRRLEIQFDLGALKFQSLFLWTVDSKKIKRLTNVLIR